MKHLRSVRAIVLCVALLFALGYLSLSRVAALAPTAVPEGTVTSPATVPARVSPTQAPAAAKASTAPASSPPAPSTADIGTASTSQYTGDYQCGTYVYGLQTFVPGDRVSVSVYMTADDVSNEQTEDEGLRIQGGNGTGLAINDSFKDYNITHSYSFTDVGGNGDVAYCVNNADGDELAHFQISVTPGIDGAGLYSQSPYPTIDPGQSVSIFITAQNTGTTAWSGSRGYTYIGLDQWSYIGEHPFANDIVPGATAGVSDTVTPPSTPGTYYYALEIRHNGAIVGPYFFIAVTVRPPVTIQSVSVSPTPASVPAGRQVQYTATANYSNGAHQDVTNAAIWYTSDSTKATVAPGGLATTHAAGSVEIEAGYGGYPGYAALNVTSPVLDRLGITPQGPTMIVGDSLRLTVIGTFSDGSRLDLTANASWYSLNPTIATVSSSGTVLAVYPGSATITATVGGVVDSSIIRVNARPTQPPRNGPIPASAFISNPQFQTQLNSVPGQTNLVGWDNCGPASATMAIRALGGTIDIDAAARAARGGVATASGTTITVKDGSNTTANLGTDFKNPLTLQLFTALNMGHADVTSYDDLRTAIAAGKPVILLVRNQAYRYPQPYLNNGDGWFKLFDKNGNVIGDVNHIVMVVGYDQQYVYINDPLRYNASNPNNQQAMASYPVAVDVFKTAATTTPAYPGQWYGMSVFPQPSSSPGKRSGPAGSIPQANPVVAADSDLPTPSPSINPAPAPLPQSRP